MREFLSSCHVRGLNVSVVHNFMSPSLLSDVTKLNAAISANSELQGKSLDEIMATATGGLFNNAAQVRNSNQNAGW